MVLKAVQSLMQGVGGAQTNERGIDHGRAHSISPCRTGNPPDIFCEMKPIVFEAIFLRQAYDIKVVSFVVSKLIPLEL